MEISEEELMAIIEREKVRDAWEIVRKAVHRRISKGAPDSAKAANAKQMTRMHNIASYLGILR